jgi:hypothetical protein
MTTANLAKQSGTHLFCHTKEHQLLATGNLIRSVQKIIAEHFPNIKQPAAIHGNNLFSKGGKTRAKKKSNSCLTFNCDKPALRSL